MVSEVRGRASQRCLSPDAEAADTSKTPISQLSKPTSTSADPPCAGAGGPYDVPGMIQQVGPLPVL